MTCSALDKVAKDFSLVMQGFTMGGRLKGWGMRFAGPYRPF